MHLMYFTEQPMSAYPEAAGRDFGATALMFSNKHFDPVAGSRLYNQYIEHYKLAEEVGFDGIMLNEHHNAPFCMQAKCNVFASILAAITERVKIVLLGNPLPLADNPVRLAEELAMIDMVSKGRLVSGFVRGGGQEQLATGVNPAFNRERFEEAHALIVRAWTQPGPFRWEGTHYQHRVVNPWAVPLQKPHPRVWIPGVLSKETIIWAAKQRYPYIALSTAIDATKKIWELYDSVAAEAGYTGGPENRGYLQRCHVAETEEKALANARQFMWMQGEFTGLAHPVWSSPSGYFSPSNRKAFVEFAVGRRGNPRAASLEDQLRDQQIIAGTPKTVLPKFRRLLEETRPSILGLWAADGFVSNEDTKTCIRLIGQEVLPAVREMGKELGLLSPFEADAPVSIKYADRRAGGRARGGGRAAGVEMKLGICIPHYGRAIEVGRLLEVVRHAEARGLDSVWVTDHVIVPRDAGVIYRHDMLDPLAMLPWLAGVTERIALGTSVVILPYRSPIPVAKLLASVDVLSGGRLIVGVAIGWLEGEFDALGVPFKERASRTDEALELFRTLWTEEQPTLTTRHHQLANLQVSPMPLQKPRPPLWIGGNSDGAFRRVARLGDGWHASSMDQATFRQGKDGVLRFWKEAGREGEPVWSLRIPILLDGVHRAAVDMSLLRGRHTLAGSPAKVAEELRGFQALGVSHVALEVSYSTYPAILETIDLIADQIRPALSSR